MPSVLQQCRVTCPPDPRMLSQGLDIKDTANGFEVGFVTVVPFFRVTEVCVKMNAMGDMGLAGCTWCWLPGWPRYWGDCAAGACRFG